MITEEYSLSPYNPQICRCRAHTQHVLFRWLWHNPGGTLKVASQELHISYDVVRYAKSRLNRRGDLHLRCPECFKPALQGLVCSSCGAELDQPRIPIQGYFDSLSPVHVIQAGNGLGSETDYQGLGLTYGHRNIRHLVERPEDPFLERAKSELWQELKEVMPSDGVVEEAARLLSREVHDFAARYPDLCRAKGLSRQLVENILALMRLRYPALRKGEDVRVGMSKSMQNAPEAKAVLSDGGIEG